MPLKQQVDATTLGKRFAKLVRERDLPVQSIWAWHSENGPHILVISEPLQLKDERPIHQASIDVERQYPDVFIEFEVVNPSWFPDFDERRFATRNAHRIEFRE